MGEPADHWIPIPECERVLREPLKVIVGADGTAYSDAAIEYTLRCLCQQDKRNSCVLLHVDDDQEDQNTLPLKWRKASVRSDCETKLTSYVSDSRGRYRNIPKERDEEVADVIINESTKTEADFIVVGFLGKTRGGLPSFGAAGTDSRPGSKQSGSKPDEPQSKASKAPSISRAPGRLRRTYTEYTISRACTALISRAAAGIILIRKEVGSQKSWLPTNRPARFVVSVSLNAAATQAFLDALRLSKAGDYIELVYVKSFMEKTESDYTKALRAKYDSFFNGLQGACANEQFNKFGDRHCTFRLIDKERGNSTAETIAAHSEAWDADFLFMGTNTMRVERGKTSLGSVCAEIISVTTCNVVVSHYTPNLDH